MKPVLQSSLPVAPWMEEITRRLPGLQRLGKGEWLLQDEAFAGQMALRDSLLAERPGEIIAAKPGSEAAQDELLETVLASLGPGYDRHGETVVRPDGVSVELGEALLTAARLVQEDMLILERKGDTPVLTAAAVCFPASWTLAQKIGRPLAAIHDPVERYDPNLAARIDRLILNLPPGEIIWRGNFLRYNDPTLHQPRKEGERRPFDPQLPVFLRVERQTLRKLPKTGAVIFGIHTYMVREADLTAEQREGLKPF